jgi:hypothetical protein
VNTTILVIDDDPDNMELFAWILKASVITKPLVDARLMQVIKTGLLGARGDA